MRRRTLFVLFLFLPLQLLTLDKDKVFESLKGKFLKIESVAVEFFSANHKKGSLVAKKGGRFRLYIGSRIIVSDGRELWNYSAKEKKVVVQKVETLSSKNLSLDNVLLNFSKDYEPVSLTRENSSENGTRNCLQLKCKSEPSHIVRVYLDDNNEIQEIAFAFDGKLNEESFIIKSLRINPKISNSQFNFKIPKGVEIIDLR